MINLIHLSGIGPGKGILFIVLTKDLKYFDEFELFFQLDKF